MIPGSSVEASRWVMARRVDSTTACLLYPVVAAAGVKTAGAAGVEATWAVGTSVGLTG